MATKRNAPARKAAPARTRKSAPSKRSRPANKAGASVQPISPCLWFDDQAEEAARFYVSVFKKAKILNVSRYPAVGQEVHRRPPGSVMTVEFRLNDLTFTALNGGPLFKFDEAVSLQVMCRTQAEIDYYWARLSEGGDASAQACGWLKDKFGLSWQIVPAGMARMMKDPKSKATERAFGAMMQMKKLDIAQLEAAFKG
jgi:predicted 3-demethylubiquinone-9 3-methyltransferase (glyoxalase superfamily)